jgi:uncharacterized membrane protein
MAAIVLIILLAGAIVGGSFAIGAPVLAVPIVIGVLLVWLGLTVLRRAKGPLPPDEGDKGVEFTERDKETLTPE